MKKIKIFTLLPLVAILSTGCSLFGNKEEEESGGDEVVYTINPTIEGGTEAEKTAILDTVNYKAITYLTGDNGATIRPGRNYTLKEDKGDCIYLVSKQKSPNGKEVEIEWEYDKDQEYFLKEFTIDERHKYIDIDYKGYDHREETGKFEYRIKKITCGSATVTEAPELRYSVNIKNFTYKFEAFTAEEINKVTNEVKYVDMRTESNHHAPVYVYPATYDIVDYEDHGEKTYSPYFPVLEENKGADDAYRYVNVKGKIIYTAPDGNWGLLADGNEIVEIYAGSGTKFLPSNYPNLSNQYVEVYGDMAQYHGNMQLSFVKKIKAIDASEITEPTVTYNALSESDIASFKQTYPGVTSDKQVVAGMINSLRSVTGRIDLSTLKDNNGAAVALEDLQDNRYTFELVVGDERITVAYDYHVGRNTNNGIFNAFKQKLVNNALVTIKGTMRYSGSNSLPFLSLSYDPLDVTAQDYSTSKKYTSGTYCVYGDELYRCINTFKDDDVGAFDATKWEKVTLYTRVGDTYDFEKQTTYNSSEEYYILSDKTGGGRWNIVPFQVDHFQNENE